MSEFIRRGISLLYCMKERKVVVEVQEQRTSSAYVFTCAPTTQWSSKGAVQHDGAFGVDAHVHCS